MYCLSGDKVRRLRQSYKAVWKTDRFSRFNRHGIRLPKVDLLVEGEDKFGALGACQMTVILEVLWPCLRK